MKVRPLRPNLINSTDSPLGISFLENGASTGHQTKLSELSLRLHNLKEVDPVLLLKHKNLRILDLRNNKIVKLPDAALCSLLNL